MTNALDSYVIAFCVTVLCLAYLRPVAFHIGLLDHPDQRKQHEGSIPLIGGISMFCGFSFAALTLDLPLTPMRGLFAATAILVVVGVLDDLHELSTSARFVAQIGAAVLMVSWGGVVLRDLGGLGLHGEIVTLGRWGIPLTLFATVGVINALNMIDGVDGLAGGISFITVMGLICITTVSSVDYVSCFLVIFAASVLAFLGFNMRFPGHPKASVFMGDAGSMFLGFVIAWYLIELSQGEQRTMSPVIGLWLLMIPLLDTVSCMLRRVLSGESPFKADRQHLHHIFLLSGYSVSQTMRIILLAQCLGVMIGLAGWYWQLPENGMFYSFLLLFLVYFVGITYIWRVKIFLSKET